MRRAICAAALAGCLVMVAGCVVYEQEIKFESDGSGRMTVDIWLDYSFYELGCDGAETFGPGLAELDGVKLKENWTKVEGELGNRRAHTRVVATFDKVERLNGYGWFGDEELSFKKEGKEFAYSHSLSSDDDQGEAWKPSGEKDGVARALFGDIVLTYTVVMPGRVRETNGTVSKDGRTVTWKFGFDPAIDTNASSRMTATSRK